MSTLTMLAVGHTKLTAFTLQTSIVPVFGGWKPRYCRRTAKFVAEIPGKAASVANPFAGGVTTPAAPAALPVFSRSYEVKKNSLLRSFQRLGPPSPKRGKNT